MKRVIDIPEEGYDWIKNGFPDNEDKEFLIEAVKNSTPYEERPQGEWTDKQYWFGHCSAECSNCGKRADGNAKDTGFGYEYLFYSFCPNCGAKMKEEIENE